MEEVGAVVLPADGHVHSQWSWDAPGGSMEQTCKRAVALGLPALAFTEHVDFASWIVRPEDLADYPHLKAFVGPDGTTRSCPLSCITRDAIRALELPAARITLPLLLRAIPKRRTRRQRACWMWTNSPCAKGTSMAQS